MEEIFPISFSIPSCKIVKHVPEKSKVMASIIPGDLKTYVYNNEEDYYLDYQRSRFARTKKKDGWDCMRHLEILANGCIPIFEKIEKIPKKTMTHYPLDLLKEIYKEDLINKWNEEKYNCYVNRLLEWTENNLSSLSMAQYILNKTGHQGIKNLLFISEGRPDYLRCMTLIGFKTLYGKKCHDFPCVSHIYKDFSKDMRKFHGMGFSYGKVLNEELKCDDNADIPALIEKHHYDIVIYGSINRCEKHMDLVQKYYKNNEIILLCGDDNPEIAKPFFKKYPNNYKFQREIPNK